MNSSSVKLSSLLFFLACLGCSGGFESENRSEGELEVVEGLIQKLDPVEEERYLFISTRNRSCPGCVSLILNSAQRNMDPDKDPASLIICDQDGELKDPPAYVRGNEHIQVLPKKAMEGADIGLGDELFYVVRDSAVSIERYEIMNFSELQKKVSWLDTLVLERIPEQGAGL